jgi:hypothetical protein
MPSTAASDSGWWCVTCACARRDPLELRVVAQRGQHHRQVAHQRAVAAVAVVGRAGQRCRRAGSAGCRGGRCCRSPPACRATRRRRPRRSAGVEGPAGRWPRSSASPSARLIVVSSVTWPGASLSQPPPMMSRCTPPCAAKRMGDLARRHELDRGAQRVAERQAQVGAQGAVDKIGPGIEAMVRAGRGPWLRRGLSHSGLHLVVAADRQHLGFAVQRRGVQQARHSSSLHSGTARTAAPSRRSSRPVRASG